MRAATRRAMSSWSSTTTVRIRSVPGVSAAGTSEGPRAGSASRASLVPAAASGAAAVECMVMAGASGGEGAAASAAAGRVRILEGESGALHGRHVVDRDAVQVLGGERVHEDPEAALVQHEVVLGGLVLDEQAVAEAAAAARLDADPQPALVVR